MGEKTDYKKHSEPVYSKEQLWIRIFIVVIIALALIIIWLFTSRNDQNFVSHFSFASTVTSIILSVLAIFMSVSGESKTQIIRDRIEQEADEINTTTTRLETQMKELTGRMEIIIHNTDNIKAAIYESPEAPQIATGSEPISKSYAARTKKE